MSKRLVAVNVKNRTTKLSRQKIIDKVMAELASCGSAWDLEQGCQQPITKGTRMNIIRSAVSETLRLTGVQSVTLLHTTSFRWTPTK